MTIFLDIFDGPKSVFDHFCVPPDEQEGIEFILAYYTYEDYSGDAYVLFKKDGKMFEVHGAHCSCYGLEDQWDPSEVTMEEMVHHLTVGQLGHDTWSKRNMFREELRKELGINKE